MDENKNDNITDVINDQKVANETSRLGLSLTILITLLYIVIALICSSLNYESYGIIRGIDSALCVLFIPFGIVIIWASYGFWLVFRKKIGGAKSLVLIALIINFCAMVPLFFGFDIKNAAQFLMLFTNPFLALGISIIYLCVCGILRKK